MTQTNDKPKYSNLDGINRVYNDALVFLQPPEKLTPAEWSEKNIKIPLGNAIAGLIRFDNAPYQVEPLNAFADPDVRKITLMWGAQTGKELSVDTPIPTPNGWVTMGDLTAGSIVYGNDGLPTTVTGVSEVKNTNDQYEIEFTDGSTLLAGADHQWLVDIGTSKGVVERDKVLTTADMINDYNKGGRYRYIINNTKPLSGLSKHLPVDPYTLGLWLGDGGSDTGVIYIANMDRELLEYIPYEVLSDNPEHQQGCSRIQFSGLTTKLREVGVLGSKHIPDDYMFADYDSRVALLRGLMDSDGTCNGNTCEISLSDERLASDAYSLICSLGIKTSYRRRRSTLYGVRKKDRFRLGFTTYANTLVPFKLCRYVSQFTATKDDARHEETFRRRVKSISPLKNKVDMKCIAVDNKERVYLAGRQMIPTHNTQLINCAMGYSIDHDPTSQIMMQPSEGDLRTWLETKFNPMVEDNEVLKDKIAAPRSREGVNNQQMKSYAGGFLMFAWAGSPRTMRGRSAPRIYCDEVDGYTYTHEGHPVSLLWQRAATFGDQRKLLVTSTPTIKGSSFVESSFLDGDQRRYHIPCPHCNEFIKLQWSNVTWQKDDDGNHLPETAVYACQECGGIITDGHKRAALRKGKWVAEKPFKGHASYHLNELYSAFRLWRDIATSFLEKKAVGDLQSFVNVSLAETWEEDGETLDEYGLAERREVMSKVPKKTIILTAGVDVQDNRLEIQVNAWARNDEMFVISHEILYGDPSTPQLWQALDSHLFKHFETEDGRELHIRATAIDSGGHFTNQVYAYCKKNYGRRVFAVKGRGGEGLPIVSRPTKNNIAKCPLFTVGVDTVKDLVFARLRIQDEGAGYVHFSDTLDDDFFKQLTAEKIVTRYQHGFARRVYEKIRKRNEALDCMVYSVAAYAIIGININALADKKEAERLRKLEENTDQQTQDEVKTKRKKRFVPRTQKNFATSWR